MRDVREQMSDVRSGLEQAVANTRMVAAQQNIIDDLNALWMLSSRPVNRAAPKLLTAKGVVAATETNWLPKSNCCTGCRSE